MPQNVEEAKRNNKKREKGSKGTKIDNENATEKREDARQKIGRSQLRKTRCTGLGSTQTQNPRASLTSFPSASAFGPTQLQ